MTTKDTLVVLLSDMHSGNNHALFPSRHWQGKNGNNHTPTGEQAAIYRQFVKFGEQIAGLRKNRRVILVHDGDAIEGTHHNNIDVCTRDTKEQADIHVALMVEFRKAIGWRAGDSMYYVAGTETHTNDVEWDIAEDLNAVRDVDNRPVFDHLQLTVNGVPMWFVHHGPTANDVLNEGKTLQNWLKSIYWSALREGKQAPQVFTSGHVHQPAYATFTVNVNGRYDYRTMHGIILPSWQAKTRYAYKKAPIARNIIGGVSFVVQANGTIETPVFCVMETESVTRIEA